MSVRVDLQTSLSLVFSTFVVICVGLLIMFPYNPCTHGSNHGSGKRLHLKQYSEIRTPQNFEISNKHPEFPINRKHAISGGAPLTYRIETDQPVVFLTIDDGVTKDPSFAEYLNIYNLKASLFLYENTVLSNPDYFREFTKSGSLIENHTVSHNLRMTNVMNYEQQRAEICGMADYVQATYGRRPVFFRPPGGAYNANTFLAANDCGMKAVVTWVATINNGQLQYQVGDKLRAGDIVLMHFRDDFKADIDAFVRAADAAGLQTDLLENWL